MSEVEVAGERSGVKGHEPSMFLERPSSARSHDIRHILTRTFRELFTSDVISPETVDNLTISRHNQDPYHQRYVSNLQQICGERERRLAECAMLERHIMQAQARAMSSEEKELNEITSSCQNYFQLGVPAGQSHFRGSLDSELLRSHGLLVPEDYSTDLPALSKPPVGSAMPNYLRATMSSENHLTPRNSGLSPLPPIVSGAQESLDEHDDQDSSNSVSDNSVEDTGEQMNKLWQSHLGSEQREVDKADLSKLDAKVNFLRNPRHVPPSAPSGGRTLIAKNTVKPKEVGIKPLPEKPVPKEPSVVFLASPPVVMFSKYAVGQVYEKVVELKNITTVLRPCRVLPPCTPYFSVGLGQFPGEHGLVAPGMSCHYTVRFSPDSLGDYEDEIRIQTQSSAPMVIQLRAGRQPPLLTLPEELDVGYCLVGALHVVHFLVRNEGGPGRFCLMPTAAWPAASFKSTVKNGTVSFPSFEVRPSVFELLAGDKTVIEVAFRPEAVGDYSENITMVCDNCQVKHFKLKGESQRAAVRLTEVEGGMDTALPGEITDVSAQHLVKFEQLNPYTYTDKAIYIKNQTNVEMRFSWEMYKPVLKSKTIEEIGDQTLETGAVERVTHIDSVFSIHPATATLAPDNIMEFKITFAPPLVGDFSSVLHMILQQIPCPPPDLLSLQSPATSHSSISVDSIAEKSNASQTFTMPSLQESTALQLEVKGQCVPLSVVLHPYAMVVPGTFLVGVTIKKQVVLVNHSYSGISFRWQPYTEDHILEIEPPFGELGPGMALDLELSITGAKPGKINHTLFCYVDNLEEPVHLHVEADIKGSDICVEQADVHFGLVLLGESATREITLTNMSQSITEWSIRESPLEEETPFTQAESVFVFSPFSGALRPLERKSIRVTFTPSESQSLNTTFVVETPDGHLCTVRVYGEVQVPRACLLSCELTLEEVYSGVGVMQPFKLLNQTLLPTSFHWGQVEGPDSDCVSVLVEPQEGLLRPREELTLYLSFTAKNQSGEVCVRVPCDVEGMDHPLWLSVSGDVRGLSVSYQVSSHGLGTSMFEESLELNYGDEISLGDTPKQYLHICNQSGITAPFSLQVGYFSGKPPTPPNATPGNTSTKGRVGLRRTPNLADPFARTSTKAYQEVCQTMLREGKGAAFIMYPACGELAPFSEEVIEVTAFSDMWGEYTDTLTIKVGDLEPMLVPVSMTVVGCPLNFQLTAALPNQSPIVRFGSHIAGTQSISRKLRVNNTSPFDIRLDWETFTVSADDRKLVDLVVRYGDTFPVRDADGNEIVPANTLPASRQNSGNRNCTFSSSKTTLAGSRQVTDLISDLPSDDSEPVDSSNEEKPKIISTFLRLHDGIETDSPYEVFPKQLLIPAKSSGAVSVKFKPLPTSTVSKGMDCRGYAHAYMTLDDKGSGTDGLVKRRQGFDMDTLRVDMTAFVKPALLTIECAEEEGMRFRGAMSDLRQGAENSAVHRNICVASLANQTETPITFRLCLMSPFRLVDLDPTSNADGSRSATVTDMCTLKPQHTLPVKVEFGVEMDLLKFLDALETGEEVDGIELEVRGQERRLQFLYYLQVQFNNTAIQYLPLHATLSVPSLVLSRETLDFGTCLVGQRRELELTVSNPTASSSYWVITTERMTETCVEDTFTLTPSSGQLEAHVTYVSDSQTLIKVFFIAKHAELYEAVFVFQGELGEEPRRLFVTGQGSYDGKHEAVVNV